MADRFPQSSLLAAPPLNKGNEDSGNEIHDAMLIEIHETLRLRMSPRAYTYRAGEHPCAFGRVELV